MRLFLLLQKDRYPSLYYFSISFMNPSLSISEISGRLPLEVMSFLRLSAVSSETSINPLASSGLR